MTVIAKETLAQHFQNQEAAFEATCEHYHYKAKREVDLKIKVNNLDVLAMANDYVKTFASVNVGEPETVRNLANAEYALSLAIEDGKALTKACSDFVQDMTFRGFTVIHRP